MRDSIARVLPAWPTDHDFHGYLLGMHAFGLEESGDYRAAETAGRRAVERNPADTWAVHAVAHVLEMEGRQLEGIAWLRGLEPHWTTAPALAVHQWWHLALFLIEQGRFEEVLAIYDSHVRGTPSGALLDLVDAAALLWRLQLAGIDVGARWEGLREPLVWASRGSCPGLQRRPYRHGRRRAEGPGSPRAPGEARSPDMWRRARGTNRGIARDCGPGRGRGHRRLRRRRFRPRRRSAAAGALRHLAHGRQPCPARSLRPDPDRRGHGGGTLAPGPRLARRAGRAQAGQPAVLGSNMPRCCNGSAMSRVPARRCGGLRPIDGRDAVRARLARGAGLYHRRALKPFCEAEFLPVPPHLPAGHRLGMTFMPDRRCSSIR